MSKKRKKNSYNPRPHVITLEGDLRGDVPPSVMCTCKWSYGPSTKLMELGVAAKEHSELTGHQLRSHG